MAKQRVILTFPQELIKEPIIYNLSQQFNLITNICRADVSEDKGWMVLELEGKKSDIEQGIDWVTSRGARIAPVVGDIAQNQD